MDVGTEAVAGGDGALEVARVWLDSFSTLEPPISAVAFVFSSFLSGMVLASSSLGAEDVLSSVVLLKSSLFPFDLRMLISLLDLLDSSLEDETERREPSLERDPGERELGRGRDLLRDGFVEGGGDELDNSSSDTDVDVDESSLIVYC